MSDAVQVIYKSVGNTGFQSMAAVPGSTVRNFAKTVMGADLGNVDLIHNNELLGEEDVPLEDGDRVEAVLKKSKNG